MSQITATRTQQITKNKNASSLDASNPQFHSVTLDNLPVQNRMLEGIIDDEKHKQPLV